MDDMKDKWNQATDDIDDKARDAGDTIRDKADDAGDALDDAADKVQRDAAYEKGRADEMNRRP